MERLVVTMANKPGTKHRINEYLWWLIKARKSLLALSATQLAEATGVDITVITRILKREIKSSSALPKLRTALGISENDESERLFDDMQRTCSTALAQVVASNPADANSLLQLILKMSELVQKAGDVRREANNAEADVKRLTETMQLVAPNEVQHRFDEIQRLRSQAMQLQQTLDEIKTRLDKLHM